MPRRVIHPGSPTKAAVFVLDPDGGAWVIKDASVQNGLFRIFGRRVLRREQRALQALDGMTGVPRFLGSIDRDAFAQEFLDGLPMRGRWSQDKAKFRQAALDLERKVAELHARGIVHLDLRQRRNLLVRGDGSIGIVDFESSFRLRPTGLQGWLLSWLRRIDQSACLKFKARYAADCLTAEEQRRVQRHRRLARLWVFHRFGPFLRLLLGRKPGRPSDGEGENVA